MAKCTEYRLHYRSIQQDINTSRKMPPDNNLSNDGRHMKGITDGVQFVLKVLGRL